MSSFQGPQCNSLSLLAGYVVAGPFSPVSDVTLVAIPPAGSDLVSPTSGWSSTVQTTLSFRDTATNQTSSGSTANLSPPISARIVSSGLVTVNVSSIPKLGAIDLQAVSTADSVQAFFFTPTNYRTFGNKVDYHLATNERQKFQAYAQVWRREIETGGYASQGNQKRLVKGTADWTAGVKGEGERRTSTIRLDAGGGAVSLGLGYDPNLSGLYKRLSGGWRG